MEDERVDGQVGSERIGKSSLFSKGKRLLPVCSSSTQILTTTDLAAIHMLHSWNDPLIHFFLIPSLLTHTSPNVVYPFFSLFLTVLCDLGFYSKRINMNINSKNGIMERLENISYKPQ